MLDVKEVNTQTGEISYRQFTEEEILSNEFVAKKLEAQKAKEREKALAKAALLERFGLTEEEGKLLLS